MENTSLTLGTSLPVPSVHALAASLHGTTDIPERYIRPEAESDPVSDTDVELPIIDFSQAKISQEERAKLGLACEEWGFFQLINHGVSSELIEKMKVDVAEFFKLPLEEKEAFAHLPNGLEGYGQCFVKSEEQKLDWADIITLLTHPYSSRNMRFWPTQPPTFRDTLDTYTKAVKEVVNCLLRIVTMNLGLESEIIMDKFKDMQQLVRMNHYPPCPKAGKAIGLSPHSDSGSLTFVLQATDVGGLQIKKNGIWFPVKPLPGAFIVNVGDSLEIISNGKYKSIEHRAIVNPLKERFSVATFHNPPPDCIVGPLPELVRGGLEYYRTIIYKDYVKAYFSAKLDGKSTLERMKLIN